MTSECRIGLVGLGHWGPNLARNFDDHSRLMALCDSDPNRLGKFLKKYPNAEGFKDFREMLAVPDITAVAIATPAETHGSLLRLALNAGKHVFVEKPICLNIEEAVELSAYANRSGLKLMVGHLLLYHPAFQKLLSVVEEGQLGSLRYVYSNRASLGIIRREENALWSFAPHDISMVLALTRSMPKVITATGGSYLTKGIDDTTLTHMAFDGGVKAHIFVSWLHPYKDHRMVVVGRDAMAVFNDVQSGPEKLQIYPHGISLDEGIPTITRAFGEPLPYDDVEPLFQECGAFVNYVEKDIQPPSDAREAIRVLQVLFDAQRSIREGRSINL